MTSPVAIVFLLLGSFQVLRVATLNVTISPSHARVESTSLQSLTISCKADVAITGCQFSWADKGGNVGPVLDLRRGLQSRPNPVVLNGSLVGYGYAGRGLAAGDCGVTLKIVGFKVWMVGCRVQARGGSWSYAWMDVFVDGWTSPPNTVTAREVEVLPGREARLSVKSSVPLTECRFSLPRATSALIYDLGAASPNNTGRHLYLGSGLEAGECGLGLAHVSEADNGPIACKIRKVSPNADDYRVIALVVASPPSAPVLRVARVGSNVTATCVVGASRPLATITWLLGDDVIRQDSLDDSPGGPRDEWRWPWVRGSVTQTVTLALRPEDDGKFLECVVTHMALERPLDASEEIWSTAMASVERDAKLPLVAANPTTLNVAELAIETARFTARAEEARAREEEAWAKNAEEELEFERERRRQSLQSIQSVQS